MSDQHTPYGTMYGTDGEIAPPDPNPETIDDLIDSENDAHIQAVIESTEEFVTNSMEPTIVEVTPRYVTVDIDEVARLNLRAEPTNDGAVIDKLIRGTRLEVIEDLDEWFSVQVVDVDQCGYVKKLYVTES